MRFGASQAAKAWNCVPRYAVMGLRGGFHLSRGDRLRSVSVRGG